MHHTVVPFWPGFSSVNKHANTGGSNCTGITHNTRSRGYKPPPNPQPLARVMPPLFLRGTVRLALSRP
jgi:hypothetical protein